MPDLTHLWQRFLLAMALLAGLAVGVGATVFGYSNLNPVDIHWSVIQIRGVPLWAVVLVPIGLILIAGTVFHWLDSLHHFTEHMRHRRRVHELEAEVARLRAHLDQVLEMPQHAEVAEIQKVEQKPALPEPEIKTIDAEMTPVGAVEATKPAKNGKKKAANSEPVPAAAAENADPPKAEPEVVAASSSANDQDK